MNRKANARDAERRTGEKKRKGGGQLVKHGWDNPWTGREGR